MSEELRIAVNIFEYRDGSKTARQVFPREPEKPDYWLTFSVPDNIPTRPEGAMVTPSAEPTRRTPSPAPAPEFVALVAACRKVGNAPAGHENVNDRADMWRALAAAERALKGQP